MAKASPSGVYVPEGFTSTPETQELVVWVSRELARISAAFEIALAREVEFLDVEPAKPREGMVRGADGTNWNPGPGGGGAGGGQGVYVYYGGTWNKL
jgi:hypothetical protein